MANDTGKLLKEISNLSSNMDVLFQELKESTKTNLEASKGIKDLAGSIKNGIKPGGEDLNETFKSFTESFTKTFSDQNSKLVNSLTDKITQSFSGSVSDFLSNVPSQIAQVKSGNVPDFKSLLGGDTIKGLVGKASSKIPGLADGGTVEKNGLAVVGEKGPELVELKAGSTVKNNAEDALTDSLLTSKSGAGVTDSDYDAKTFRALRKAVKELSPTEPDSFVSAFVKYAQMELDPSELPEFLSDPDYLKDELSYFKDSDEREKYEYKDVGEPIKKEEMPKVGNYPGASVETNTPKLEEVVIAQQKTETTSAAPAQIEKKPVDLTQKINSNNTSANAFEMLNQKLLANASPEAKKAIEAAKASSSLVNEKATLKEADSSTAQKPADTKQETPKEPSQNLAQKAVSQAKELQSQASSATKMSQSGVSAGTNTSQTSAINPKDLSEIKTLLAGIYSALKSPLTISNDFPFRPNSNTF